ncbi:PREDICTED: leucine-rich repeat-containing protein 4B-like [Branchiostoma belcheri]|uniref:Leucine-rich repeat-containing protein 4B-like n=1 Tax=Branchiostoma belcheri TaxID=7741 RepID=A0A6P4Y378_BRABE|nr:PREDICTED: leucine-rich repeat-containing protein 4B-like [Branchiostoma belcheri]
MGRKLLHLLVYLLIILKEPNMPEANAVVCGCKPSWRSYYCRRNEGLTSIPQKLPTSISKLLCLEHNKISKIEDGALANLPRLGALYLNDNQITTIHCDAFAYLPCLYSLDLRNNQITTIHSDTFANLPQLQSLCLKKNKITTIHSDTFANLPKLRFLSLYDNQITTIPSEWAGPG